MPQQAQSMKLAILNGNPNNLTNKNIKKRLKNEKNFDKIGSDRIIAPKWMTSDERKIFNEIKRNLQPLGLLNDLDNSLLARYSVTYVNYVRVKEFMDSVELSTKGNPVIKELASLDRMLGNLSKELGLSPSSRASLAIALKDEPDDEKGDEF